ncbi:hypothetical protein P3W43_00450 [Salinicola salarius]|uniref:hypothetical protein n=1 Tax=Salinicola salarius TaxID=430457 RepID=UPI0023E3D6D1|nr:hypothetical protein [Salinicola salarius]MDF3917317.1 hypothetical protein [Salinicola salarius]
MQVGLIESQNGSRSAALHAPSGGLDGPRPLIEFPGAIDGKAFMSIQFQHGAGQAAVRFGDIPDFLSVALQQVLQVHVDHHDFQLEFLLQKLVVAAFVVIASLCNSNAKRIVHEILRRLELGNQIVNEVPGE